MRAVQWQEEKLHILTTNHCYRSALATLVLKNAKQSKQQDYPLMEQFFSNTKRHYPFLTYLLPSDLGIPLPWHPHTPVPYFPLHLNPSGFPNPLQLLLGLLWEDETSQIELLHKIKNSVVCNLVTWNRMSEE